MIVHIAKMTEGLPAVFRLMLGLVLSPVLLPLIVTCCALFAIAEILVIALTIPLLPLYIKKNSKDAYAMRKINPFYVFNEDIMKFDTSFW